MSLREIKEGQQEQGSKEEVIYDYTVDSSWGAAPLSSIEVKIFDLSTTPPTDVSSDKMVGTPSSNALIITLPRIKILEVGKTYQVRIIFTVASGQIRQAEAYIKCET